MPAHYLKQLEENTLLKRGIFVPIAPEDDDDQHLVAMGQIDPENVEMVAHQALHIQAKIHKGTQPKEPQGQSPQGGGDQMLNGAMSQAMSQAGSQISKLNQQ